MEENSIGSQIIHDPSEKSLVLNDKPGLLPVERVKPKTDQSKNTRVTQIHGSLERKDVLSMVKLIRGEKQMKERAKEDRKLKNSLIKKNFINAKKNAFVKRKNVMLSN